MVAVNLKNERLITCILTILDKELKDNPTYYKELRLKLRTEISKAECKSYEGKE